MHSRYSTLVVAATMLAALAGACNDADGATDAVKGSGNVVAEARDVGGFAGLALQGSGTVIFEVGDTESVTIEAEDNILPMLTTEVSGGVLRLGSRDSIAPTRAITYRIVAPVLESLEVSGSGEISATGIVAPQLEVRISGSGLVHPAGSVDELSVRISGSGDYEGDELLATTGDVTVSGSGHATMNVSGELDVTVSGSGEVEYMGQPALRETVSGSGRVSQR